MTKTVSLMAALIIGIAALTTVLVAPSMARDSQASTGFVPDSGKFQILAAGQQVGQEKFDFSPNNGNWVVHDSAEIRTAGGTERIRGTLELHSDGAPVRYTWSTQGTKKASSTVTFNGRKATIHLHVQGKQPYVQDFTFQSSRIVILDNNLYDQYAILAHLYDWQKKGSQTFSVLIPQELTPGTVTVESLGGRDVGGKKLQELQVRTADLQVNLFLDGGRLIRIVSPSTNTEIVRE